MELTRYVLVCDLKDDPRLIEEYERHHRNIWPEITESIKESGIVNMDIYRRGSRLVMIIETEPGFSFELKGKVDARNSKVQEWESLMWKYQQAIPNAEAGEKWILMENIFSLKN